MYVKVNWLRKGVRVKSVYGQNLWILLRTLGLDYTQYIRIYHELHNYVVAGYYHSRWPKLS